MPASEFRSVWYFGGPWDWRHEHLPLSECKPKRHVAYVDGLASELQPMRLAVYQRTHERGDGVTYGFRGWQDAGEG